MGFVVFAQKTRRIYECENCEFVGCTHVKENACGIKAAVASGKISQERYERFCKIYEELKDKEKHKW